MKPGDRVIVTVYGEERAGTAEPHPHEYFAKQGLRMRDYFNWTFRYGGDTARAQACKAIETACGEG